MRSVYVYIPGLLYITYYCISYYYKRVCVCCMYDINYHAQKYDGGISGTAAAAAAVFVGKK